MTRRLGGGKREDLCTAVQELTHFEPLDPCHGQTAFGRPENTSHAAASATLAPAVREAFTAYQEVRFGGRVFDRERELCMLLGLDAARRSYDPAPRSAGQT